MIGHVNAIYASQIIWVSNHYQLVSCFNKSACSCSLLLPAILHASLDHENISEFDIQMLYLSIIRNFLGLLHFESVKVHSTLLLLNLDVLLLLHYFGVLLLTYKVFILYYLLLRRGRLPHFRLQKRQLLALFWFWVEVFIYLNWSFQLFVNTLCLNYWRRSVPFLLNC